MKMVSAAKLRKAQDAITQMRPYAEKMQEILEGLSTGLDTSENVYARETKGEKILIVAITSNRGLCGAFNSQIIKQVKNLIGGEYKDKNVTILTFGKKAEDAFRRTEYFIKGTLLPRHTNEIFDDLTFENASKAATKVMDAFEKKQFDKVVLVYNSFKNAAVQVVKTEQWLPIQPVAAEDGAQVSSDYIFEPNKEEIVNDLIPKTLRTQFYKALLDSFASNTVRE